ncbi:alpha/beta hydrolase [Chelatococcus sp. SYSU_G07232]|uniref:Alpha/beta hydrolase n=1 Tax=Chelatococcus albus TaxID=3047466 RepID=A0ABT7AJ47_9HYPH|nr:alpha/beta hydrolase [Chelatococcus sp. SYSU_G07232]MDJ1159402.1 alpha/beta hydrolase [Chelatococcus sp. SYSU_G07232]
MTARAGETGEEGEGTMNETTPPRGRARDRAVFTGAAGNRLVATVAGEGPRVALLLHGGGQTRHAWAETAERLAAAGWTAIALDQRGHGESEWPAEGAYAFPDYAGDAAAVARTVAAERGTRPVAIGASLGGIASLLALGAGAVFSGLVLVDIVPQMDPRGVAHVQGFMRARAREGFASVEEAADAVAAYLPHRPRPRSLEGLRKNLRLDPDGRWRWHWDPRFLDGPRSVNTDWAAVGEALHEAARNLAVPSLLVRGGSSELVSEAAARAFLEMAPATEFADIAEARHMVAGDRNDAFAAAILDFLARRFA